MKKKKEKKFLNNRENRERILLFQILYECLCMWNVPCLNINLAFDPRGPFCKSLPVSQAPPPKSCQQPDCVKHVLKVTKF